MIQIKDGYAYVGKTLEELRENLENEMIVPSEIDDYTYHSNITIDNQRYRLFFNGTQYAAQLEFK